MIFIPKTAQKLKFNNFIFIRYSTVQSNMAIFMEVVKKENVVSNYVTVVELDCYSVGGINKLSA